MNPYPIIAGILIFCLTLFGAYEKGRHDSEMDALVIQQAANKAAAEALISIREELAPKVTNVYKATEKSVIYGDCKHSDEGWSALMEVYK